MTTELEKQFFDTFGIEQCFDPYIGYTYPQISDKQYLELICIDFAENPYKCRGDIDNIEKLKNYILEQFIHEFENDLYLDKESVKHQVQAIFEGERWSNY